MKETRVLVCILVLCVSFFSLVFTIFSFSFTDWVYIQFFWLMLLVEQIVIVLRETAQLLFIPFNNNKKKYFSLFCLCFHCSLLKQSLFFRLWKSLFVAIKTFSKLQTMQASVELPSSISYYCYVKLKRAVDVFFSVCFIQFKIQHLDR